MSRYFAKSMVSKFSHSLSLLMSNHYLPKKSRKRTFNDDQGFILYILYLSRDEKSALKTNEAKKEDKDRENISYKKKQYILRPYLFMLLLYFLPFSIFSFVFSTQRIRK